MVSLGFQPSVNQSKPLCPKGGHIQDGKSTADLDKVNIDNTISLLISGEWYSRILSHRVNHWAILKEPLGYFEVPVLITVTRNVLICISP